MTTQARKDAAMAHQKSLIAGHFDNLARAPETGRKVVSTFVPGNLSELLRCFDVVPNLPEINALQSGMRQRSGGFIVEAEKHGLSEDVCTYVKCDLGMILRGDDGPTGQRIPPPDLLLLSYTGCFTFMKWFELLRDHYGCETAMLHVPYQGDGVVTDEMRDYVVGQLKEKIIPTLERITGKRFDIDRLREELARSAQAEDDLVWVLEQGKRKPSPIDGYFGAVYYIGPIFTAFRGSEDAVEYYRLLREEVEARIAEGRGPPIPEGELEEEKFRLVVEGPPSWTHFRQFWQMLADEGAVAVASTYTKVGGMYDRGFRHDPSRPLESLADYCMGCYTNLDLPTRTDLLCQYVTEYQADGLLVNSIKSCNSFSAGQLVMLREVEKRTGRPAVFIESDLVDPRYFSAANIKNRLESYLQMIDMKRRSREARA
jgi:benzoyl-CoA reductase subunit B